MTDQFKAKIEAWARQTDQRMLAIFHESTQRVVSIAQSNIPVDTGYARASIRASLESMPTLELNSRGEKGISYPYDDSPVALVIASAKIDQTIYIGWTASYVPYLEWGWSKQAPHGFIGLAAQQWPHIVEQVTQELKNRAG